MKNEITFEIKKHLGVISEKESGWKKELNLIAWNNNPPKFDIREWDSEHKKMSKGLTFTKEEMLRVLGICAKNAKEIEKFFDEEERTF